MALSRTQIVDAAYATVRDHGLAGLSMRRLARDLDVQPGALYYHVASKQELVAAVAEHILATSAPTISTTDPAQAVWDLRQALLPVRDSAEILSFVEAFKPAALVPLRRLAAFFVDRLPEPQAGWAAQTLVHYVLGFVAQEHNHAELVRATILDDPQPASASDDAFRFGVDTILRGVALRTAGGECPEQDSNLQPAD